MLLILSVTLKSSPSSSSSHFIALIFFFISVVCSGVANAEFKDKLDNQLLAFAEKVLSKAKEADKNQELVSTGLEEHFNAFDDVSE